MCYPAEPLHPQTLTVCSTSAQRGYVLSRPAPLQVRWKTYCKETSTWAESLIRNETKQCRQHLVVPPHGQLPKLLYKLCRGCPKKNRWKFAEVVEISSSKRWKAHEDAVGCPRRIRSACRSCSSQVTVFKSNTRAILRLLCSICTARAKLLCKLIPTSV